VSSSKGTRPARYRSIVAAMAVGRCSVSCSTWAASLPVTVTSTMMPRLGRVASTMADICWMVRSTPDSRFSSIRKGSDLAIAAMAVTRRSMICTPESPVEFNLITSNCMSPW
jgi:hypothetical protein